MKKIKLLPSIIMLALCLCVLGIGVYSATTGSNTITGTLTVNGAGNEVDIKVYEYTGVVSGEGLSQIDHSLTKSVYGKLLGQAAGVRASSTISGLSLEFNSDEANTYGEVDIIDIVVAVTNKSTRDIGIYFWDGVGIKPEQVTDAFIDAGHLIYGHQDMYADTDTEQTTAIVDAEYSFYHHIPGCVASSTENSDYGDNIVVSSTRYYTEYMHIYFTLKEAGFSSTSQEVTLDIRLNVEEYHANIDSTNVETAYDYDEHTFVKIDKGISSQVEFGKMVFGPTTSGYHNDTIKYVVTNYDATYCPCFFDDLNTAGCASLMVFSIPISITSIAAATIEDLSITTMILPFSITQIGTINSLSSMTTLRIPASVNEMYRLNGWTNLTRAYFALGNQDWWDDDGAGRTRVYDLSNSITAATRLKEGVMHWYNSAS